MILNSKKYLALVNEDKCLCYYVKRFTGISNNPHIEEETLIFILDNSFVNHLEKLHNIKITQPITPTINEFIMPGKYYSLQSINEIIKEHELLHDN